MFQLASAFDVACRQNLLRRLLGRAARQLGVLEGSGIHSSSDKACIGIEKLLIANRGEIACRVIATARALGIPTVAVFSDADKGAKHVRMADQAFNIGPARAADSYLNRERILEVASRTNATAIHPGYGFLSEDAEFAHMCSKSGVAFVGPPPDAMKKMGDKSEAKTLMRAAGVPVVPGYEGDDQSIEVLCQEGIKMGFPILVKAVMGGGGKGMKLVTCEDQLKDAILSAQREAKSSFGDDRVLLERFIQSPRHIEVQVFADAHGNAVHLFERDCSLQRRHQKVLEESPAPNISENLRDRLGKSAVDATRAVGYVNAGTVEFIVDTKTEEFFFMEMNTRLQVEHPVSEWVSGVDLVEWQLRIAAGERLAKSQKDLHPRGHAIEARVYSELPHQNFLPGTGRVQRWKLPEGCVEFCLPPVLDGVRVDSGVEEGDEVGVNYDPMIAKVIAGGENRDRALQNLQKAIKNFQVYGLPTNLSLLARALEHEGFVAADLNTAFIDTHKETLLAPPRIKPQMIALAAVARLKITAERHHASLNTSPGGPWRVLNCKQLNRSSDRRFEFRDTAKGQHGANVVVKSDGEFLVDVNGSSEAISVTNVSITEGDSIRMSAQVSDEFRQGEVAIFDRGSEKGIALMCGGETVELMWSIPKWEPGEGVQGHSTGKIIAPMPGRVVQVAVSEGDVVKTGASLIVLEAMKMEHEVRAMCDGKVTGIRVTMGGRVDDGQVMLTLE
ncbi:hypothetical protein BSKO_04971 [Bryopsis sp. KO-2023]|nr:hypothetical protein BSKO_04971 [Bryopsis sp. KO-2023]